MAQMGFGKHDPLINLPGELCRIQVRLGITFLLSGLFSETAFFQDALFLRFFAEIQTEPPVRTISNLTASFIQSKLD